MNHPELAAVLDLLGMLLTDWRTLMLVLFLVVAAIWDCRTRRIPNALVAGGIVFALIYNTAVPQGTGYAILFPLSGMMLGFALFLPLYIIRATGAGDVKLFAMVGAFLGPLATFNAALSTFIVGGVLSFLFVLKSGAALRTFENLVMFVRVGLLGVVAGAPQLPRFAAEKSAGRLPYGVSIALGTIGYLTLHQLGIA